jgi:hypothetical protein
VAQSAACICVFACTHSMPDCQCRACTACNSRLRSRPAALSLHLSPLLLHVCLSASALQSFPLSLARPFMRLWSLAGTPWGQAAVFSEYELEDGTVVRVQGDAPPQSSIELPPSEADVAAATAAATEQAAAVRALKEVRGLANSDPEVQAAVAELQALKATAAEVSARYEAALAEAAGATATAESVEEEA